MKNFTALVSLGLAPVPPAIAGEMDTKAMDPSKTETNTRDAAVAEAFATAMKAIPYTANADIDFVAKMILHHRGAVDMARLELEYGKNPKIRKLAESILKSQSHQLVEMDAWLAKYRSTPPN